MNQSHSKLKNVSWNSGQAFGCFLFRCVYKVAESNYVFIMSVHLEQLGFHWVDLMKFDSVVFFENLLRKFEFH
jgi:hypothetical protein